MKSTRRGGGLLPRWIISGGFVLLFLLAVSPGAEAAVTGKITGVVLDANTGEPLPGANVVLEGTDMGAAADPDGYFFIIRISPGTYNVQARMMGYESVTQTGAEVSSDHTTRLTFRLSPSVIPGEGITVSAAAEIIKMDLSSSAVSAKSDEIDVVPFVDEIGDYINRQAGIKGWNVRGGSLDQVGFSTDGLNLVDGRTNNPALMPPLSIVRELNVIKGGFAAEYGNLRSGLINIVTRDPADTYHGSLNFRYIPAHLKHRGPTVYDTTHYWVGSYVLKQDSLCWLGTAVMTQKANAALASGDTALYEHYDNIVKNNIKFGGWLRMAGRDPDSAAKLREKFIWTHRLQGADELTPAGYEGEPRVGEYGENPDWNVDAGFGGPVPVIGEYLGDLGFYVAHRQDRDAFALPASREFYEEANTMLKLVTHLGQSVKVTYQMMYGKQKTLSASSNGELGAEGHPYGLNLADGDLGTQFVDFVQGTGYVSGAGGIYVAGGDDVFRSELVTNHAAYSPVFIPWYDISNNMQGITFDHALSDKTFYTVRVSYLNNKRYCSAYETFDSRDTATTYTLPNGSEVTEIPYGYYLESADIQVDGVWMGAHCAGAVDSSESNTLDLKVDLTSQLNPHNEVKVGLEYNLADMHTRYEKNRWESTHENWVVDWEANPMRGGAYIQDKIEFEGIIANVGFRADWNIPNMDWFDVDTFAYNYYLTKVAKTSLGEEGILELGKTEPTSGHLKISPRVGISHPISENAKLYFNYGDFYSLPASYNMYQIFWAPERYGIRYLGNPELDWALTRAYELGTDWNIGNLFRLHLAGYYKDVRNQALAVEYIGYDNDPQYKRPENLSVEDIRGIDFRISKDFGNWVRGWVNYDYRVEANSRLGKETHYQSLLDEATTGAWDTLEYHFRAQPIMEANIQFLTPGDLGPFLGNISLSFNYTWEAGDYTTYDPLERDLYLNLQWKAYTNVQARLQKAISFAGVKLSIFGEVNNLFDWKYLDRSSGCFYDQDDEDKYKTSLHLPIFGEEGYEELGVEGNDQLGEVSSEDKPYIDDPALTHLAFHNPRYFVFGVKVDF